MGRAISVHQPFLAERLAVAHNNLRVATFRARLNFPIYTLECFYLIYTLVSTPYRIKLLKLYLIRYRVFTVNLATIDCTSLTQKKPPFNFDMHVYLRLEAVGALDKL